MNKSFINVVKVSCFSLAFTVILSGCEGKGQIPVHKKDAENTQTSRSGAASEPSGTSGSSGSPSSGN